MTLSVGFDLLTCTWSTVSSHVGHHRRRGQQNEWPRASSLGMFNLNRENRKLAVCHLKILEVHPTGGELGYKTGEVQFLLNIRAHYPRMEKLIHEVVHSVRMWSSWDWLTTTEGVTEKINPLDILMAFGLWLVVVLPSQSFNPRDVWKCVSVWLYGESCWSVGC